MLTLFRRVLYERASPGIVLAGSTHEAHQYSTPHWDVLSSLQFASPHGDGNLGYLQAVRSAEEHSVKGYRLCGPHPIEQPNGCVTWLPHRAFAGDASMQFLQDNAIADFAVAGVAYVDKAIDATAGMCTRVTLENEQLFTEMSTHQQLLVLHVGSCHNRMGSLVRVELLNKGDSGYEFCTETHAHFSNKQPEPIGRCENSIIRFCHQSIKVDL